MFVFWSKLLIMLMMMFYLADVSGVTEIRMLTNEFEDFICFFCEEHFNEKQHLIRHQDTCSMRLSGFQTLFTDLKVPQQQEPRAPDDSRSAKRGFLEHFGVITTGRAEALCRKNTGEQVLCDVIVIDDSDEDDTEMELQHHPRPMSPRSLILPESRPTNFRRSTSFERKNAVVLKRSGDTVSASRNAEKLLRIDVCSPLGQRLRDHLDMFSRPKSEPQEDEKKRPLNNKSGLRNCQSSSSFNDKLRQLKDYQITFRPSRQQCSYSHAFKFTTQQRKEFCQAFDCGLSVRARRLLRKMKPCRVQVPKLSPKSYRLCMPEWELTANQNRVHLSIHKSVVSLDKYDSLAKEIMLNADRNHLNGSEVVSCQTISMSSISTECSTRDDTTALSLTPENSQCCFDSQASAAESHASALTADGISSEFSQQSAQLSSTEDAADNRSTDESDSRLVSNESVFKDKSSTNSDNSGACSTSIDSSDCPDLLALTTATSNAGLLCSPSVNTVKVQTADKDCQTADCATDCGAEESLRSKLNKSSWSMSDDLPALSFLCNICRDIVNCDSDSKSLIFNHYAGHGITNIDLLDDTTASGEKVIKLIEITDVKANTAIATPTQASSVSIVADQKSPSKSILVQPSRLQDLKLGVSNTALAAEKKRRRVSWADEICSDVTQCVPSPVYLDAAQQDATIGLSEEQSTSCPSPEVLNGSEVSALYSNNAVFIPPASVALSAELSVTGSNWSSAAAAGESISCSLPVTSTVSNAIPCPNLVKTSSDRARSFWSNSLERITDFRKEHRNPSLRPVSTALTTKKRAANDMLLATSVLVGARDGIGRSRRSLPLSVYTSSGQPTLARDNSYTPVTSRTRNLTPTLNTCRQSYWQKTNVICID